MIARDPAGAARDPFDLIVVGGGIYGVALALEAARRGIRPALVERGDFGGATSWNSLRIVHGGLRYLQSLDLPRFRESVAERSWFLREFPDLVAPLPCLMPLYGRGLRRPSVLRAALAANDLLSRHRNRDVRRDRRLGPGQVVTAAHALQIAPGIDPRGLRGAALWHDGAMPDSQRLVIEMLHWATACGGVALNYCEARGLVRCNGAVAGVHAADLFGGGEIELRAPRVVNCAGPWCEDVARRLVGSAPTLFRPSLAFNVLLAREPTTNVALAVTVEGPDGGTYFLHPWKGMTLAGTQHAAWHGGDGVSESQIRGFLEGLNRGLPGYGATRDEILRLHWGLLPARRAGTRTLAVREVILDHGAARGPAGLWSVSGVKFTTARRVAETTLTRILARDGVTLPAYGSVPRPVGTAPPAAEEFEALLERDESAAREEVVRRVETEAAVKLDDLLLRRTDWGADPRRGALLGGKVAALAGWN